MIRSVHGPVLPVWTHGSSVQYSVAPRASRPRLFERVHLGVRFAGALVRALTEHDPFVRHDARTNDGIRRRAAEAAARVLERPPHPPFVVYHFS